MTALAHVYTEVAAFAELMDFWFANHRECTEVLVGEDEAAILNLVKAAIEIAQEKHGTATAEQWAADIALVAMKVRPK